MSQSDTHPVLLMTFASSCQHCLVFKRQHLNNLIEKLKQHNIEHIVMETPTMGGELSKEIPQINQYVKWYPSFFTVTKGELEKMKRDKTHTPQMQVYNGTCQMVGGKPQIGMDASSRRAMTPDAMLEWVLEQKPKPYTTKGVASHSGFASSSGGLKVRDVLPTSTSACRIYTARNR